MITTNVLEVSDMEKVVNKVLRDNGGVMPASVLIALSLQELSVHPSDFTSWTLQLQEYISDRLFKHGDIYLHLG